MADNTVLNAGSGGDTIATDEIAGIKHQQVKVEWGVDGTATPVSAANPMPVVQTGTHAVNATLGAETTKVIGTVNLAAAQTLATVTTVGTVSAVTAISNALPAGTNAIGKLAANTGVDIGDVDVTSVIPGTTATSLGKAEDAAHTSGDTGVMALAVRRDADTTLADTTGDYAPLQVNAAGSLKVAITSGAGSGGTSIADAAAFTRATTSVTPVAGVVETSAPTLTNGNTGAVSLTTGGAMRVAVTSGGITGAVEDAVASGSAEGVLGILVRDDALATLTPVDGDYTVGRTNARGAQWVALDSTAAQTVTLAAETTKVIGTVNVASAQTLATVTTVGTVTTCSTVTNVATIGTSVTPGTSAAHLGKAVDSAAGGTDTGVLQLAVRDDVLATLTPVDNDYTQLRVDSTGAQWVRSTGELADDAAFTPGTSRVTPIGLQADETATDSVDEGDVGAPRMTLDRKQIMTLQPHTAGGLTIFRSLDIDETEEDVKTAAGQLYWIHAMNMVATARYLKFYNATAASVTVGSTTPVLTIPIPANSTTGAGFTVSIPQGLAFSTAICVACTTGVADADTGAPGANDVIINLGYM